MWADLSGLSDNWDKAISFLKDIGDGVADGIIDASRPELVQFVTMGELSKIYDSLGGRESERGVFPQSYALFPNSPNPFNSETRIRFTLPKSGYFELEIFNPSGQLVRTFTKREKHGGTCVISWDGRDNRGRELSSGVYLYRLKGAGNLKGARRMILLR